jgi:hypothetical protein
MLRQRKSGHALSFQRRDNSLLPANIPGGIGRHKGLLAQWGLPTCAASGEIRAGDRPA